MKKIILTLLCCISLFRASADEGMWLPMLIRQNMISMKAHGCRLEAEDIYSVNRACLKDAIVHFGSGCTGAVISDQGLLITNHHCGYGQIQRHSSLEHDYLTDGFWAMSRAEELPNPGLTVTFLRRMEDVTEQVLRGVSPDMTEAQRSDRIKQNSRALIAAATSGTPYTAQVNAMYYGNQYFLFVNEVFRDVRLVGAPPASIGKFGGDTDNWMWPRHTGDFSIFRIYADAQNRPADYAKDNQPYRPLQSLTISTKGVKEGDFTMVYGYPGRTQEYILSDAVRYTAEMSNPVKIALRTQRLEIMNAVMTKDRGVRIQYASKNARVANAWKKWQGERKGLLRLGTVARKQAFEEAFMLWAADKPEYAAVVPALHRIYEKWIPLSMIKDYYTETLMATDLYDFIRSLRQALRMREAEGEKQARLQLVADGYFKNYYQPIDKATVAAMLKAFCEGVPETMWPELFSRVLSQYGGNTDLITDYLYENSIFVSREKVNAWIKAGRWHETAAEDPAVQAYDALCDQYATAVQGQLAPLQEALDLSYRTYMRGQMAFDTDRVFFPDANSTLRVSYGPVMGYRPADAVRYLPQSTIEGIMEKDNPEIYDYNIPQRLRDVYARKDYGRWEADGTVPVAFLAANHTSGGNSGSPVLNADGALLGLNFDRVWEGTMSDIEFDPSVCRNIAVDIRYVLFMIEKIGGAAYLFDEMHFYAEN